MQTILFFTAAILTVPPVFLQSADLIGNTAFLPVHQQTVAKIPAILRLHNNLNADGTFTYTFDTENGISAHAESSITKTADPEQSIQTIRGQYSYTGPDGVQYTVQYIADHNGYQAFGEHLPTPPPIPEAILRSLEHNAAHPEEDDGIVAASPALAPSSNAILSSLSTRSSPPLQPIVAAPLTQIEQLTTPTPTRSAALPKQQQQLAQAQLLSQTQVLQQQQLQPQTLQLAQLQPQQLQLQPQQLQLQPQQLQLQPQQLQLQPQQLQLQPQLQLAQLQSRQLQPQPLQPQQLQPQQLQPQLQSQQLQGQRLQPQDFLTQFAPSFQNFESQRRSSTNA